MGKMASKFEVNDIIVMISTRGIYPSYFSLAKFLGADIGGKWKRYSLPTPQDGNIAKILKITSHVAFLDGPDIALIEMCEDEHRQYLLGLDYMKLKKRQFLDDSLFEI